MKKILLLFVFALSVGITSCSSDDDNGGPANAESVVGTWEIYEVYSEFEFDDFGTVEETISTSSCNPTPVVSFNADGSLNLTDFELEFDFDDNEECFIDGELQGTWEDLGSGTFRLAIDGDTQDAEIRMSGNRIFITLEEEFFGGTMEYRGNKV